MKIQALRVEVADLAKMRDVYQHEMNCQIVHDSLHARAGWTESYSLHLGETIVGCGSVAVAGPWKGKSTLFEFYVLPPHQSRVFDLFGALVTASNVIAIETQSNDELTTVMLHAFAQNVTSESILFHDKLTTALTPPGTLVRQTTPEDAVQLMAQDLDSEARWVVEVGSAIAAAGGILFHYNRPYGDIYMKVAEPFRRRGLGAYLVQELKRVCYAGGSVPAARCNPNNLASRKTLQKAGFVPCGHILTGTVVR